MSDFDEYLMPVHVAAARLGVSRALVYGLMSSGQLAYVKLGRARRIPYSAIKNLVAKNLRGPDGCR